ncbi:zinc-dependent metalloprotease [Actinotalea solisilvae]|uniref:zinc-dependent metalloprotease n=1 Tax=Actinotalea solisilvae TaxID=2072922 RepID=UPI0018F1AB6D|nr:zinc-dependent metalloprotease [Actinotalea solisilvae]
MRSDAAPGAPGGGRVSDLLVVDWDRAARWAGRLAPPGPAVTRDEAAEAVAALRDAAERAYPLALRASRLGTAVKAAGREDQRAAVAVLDRPGWALAAARSFQGLAPVPDRAPDGVVDHLRAGPATGQAAGLLSLLAARVLGQFDPFATDAPAGGRLVLVAPNVLHMRARLSADLHDFALWVCVHEQTHALQFAAAPWLADHLRTEVRGLVAELSARGPELTSAVERALSAARRRGSSRPAGVADGPADDDLGVLGLVLDPAQRERLDAVTATMSLLEGHAEVAMDSVGARSIPSARRLRARFDAQRRRRASPADRVLRRLLGLEAKMAQYRRGAAFVRAVRTTGGSAALDAVWAGPHALPSAREIADPRAWVRRVHG